MKAILTLVFGILISTAAMANTPAKQVKVETTVKSVVLNIAITKANTQKNGLAQVYMFKNARAKKELKFVTKANTAKMA